MHTSAEYKALCLQIYRNALASVTAEVKRIRSGDRGAKPAVLMDLDATVIDNSKFDLFLLANDLKFSHKIRRDWFAGHPEGESLVPGALDFIRAVEDQNVEVIFISSRLDDQKEATFSTLKRLGVFPGDAELKEVGERLLLREDVRSKEPRWRKVEESFTVVAYLGDNLADFASEFEAPAVTSYAQRNESVSSYADKWGSRWFVLPNPVYGDWLMSLTEKDIEGLLNEAKD
jgi:acid phosphatase